MSVPIPGSESRLRSRPGAGARRLRALWEVLGSITRLHYRVSSADGLCGEGQGRVTVSLRTPKSLVFEESGRWRTNRGHSLAFSNRYLWERDSGRNRVALAHLRFGDDSPVPLLAFAPADDDDLAWRALDDHVCRHDHYRASIAETAGGFTLCWHIAGPHKRQRVCSEYTADGRRTTMQP